MRNGKKGSSVDGGNSKHRSQKKVMGKLIASFIGARVAQNSGKSGIVGAVGGAVAGRLIKRSPMGAMMIGGLWVGRKLYKRHQTKKFNAAADAAKPVGPAGGPEKVK